MFLLCSDGLTGLVNPQEIGAVVSAMPSDQAVRLLVHLANLRGGPDNITVMIVRVPGGSTGEPGAKARGKSGGLKRAFAAWNKTVPWPFTALASGCALALLSLLMQQGSVAGAMLLFVVSAVIIVAGLLGLILQLKKEPETRTAPAEEAPRTLNVYKRHDCAITKDLAAKFAELETSLADGMKGQNVPVDWAANAKLVAAAENADGSLNDLMAFRARCESLLFLAEAYHKSRHKQESFQPSWKKPDMPSAPDSIV